MNLVIYKNNVLYSLVFIILTIFILGENSYSIIIPCFLGFLLLLESISYSISKGSSFFHPYSFTGIMLIWVLIISPIVSIYYDKYLFNPPKEIDWVKWVSITAWIYLGLIINYYYLGKVFLRKKNENKFFFLRKKRIIVLISLLFLLFSLLCQVVVFVKFGGINGYMETWSEDRTQFDGLGTLFMLAEPFPILLLLSICLIFRPEDIKRPLLFVFVIFLVFFMLKMIFGGFRGSRSNTIWGLFWFAGIVHIYYFKLKKIYFLLGVAFLIVFMNLYSLYKSFGIDAFSMQYSLSDTGRFDNNPTLTILLNDFSRIGLHAYILSEYFNYHLYDIKFGQTYLYSLCKIFPIWDDSTIYSKNAAGSEILYGRKASLIFQDYHNSRIFGAYGEALLNFGPILAIFVCSIFSYIIVLIDNLCRKLNKYSPFYLMIPFLSNFSLMLLLADSGNIVFFLFKNGMLVLFYLLIIKYFGYKKIFYKT